MAVKTSGTYKPAQNEPYMNPKQKEFFRRKLLAWKEELLQDSSQTIRHLQEETSAQPDLADRVRFGRRVDVDDEPALGLEPQGLAFERAERPE